MLKRYKRSERNENYKARLSTLCLSCKKKKRKRKPRSKEVGYFVKCTMLESLFRFAVYLIFTGHGTTFMNKNGHTYCQWICSPLTPPIEKKGRNSFVVGFLVSWSYLWFITDWTLSAGFESAILPSWFHLFNKELIRNVSFSEHEAFDHPVACKIIEDMKYSVFLFLKCCDTYICIFTVVKYLIHILLYHLFYFLVSFNLVFFPS